MLATAFLALALVPISVHDHRQTRREIDKAYVFAWYCDHRELFCDRTKPDAIHGRWANREHGYEAAEALFALVFVGTGFRLFRSRRTG